MLFDQRLFINLIPPMIPTSCYRFADENRNLTSELVTLHILGFDRQGFTHDVLKAVSNDDLAHILAVRIESTGLRSEGYLRVRVGSPELIPVLVQRLRKVIGLVSVFRSKSSAAQQTS
ncbi:ACT domain-containing protein [Larkinella sp.]|uniref:ACT domain-containing protein n=1 Tax=Larkinella sp. TaxID=2034517 RepID=UPI003BAAEDE9